MEIVNNAQNRNFYLYEGKTISESYIISHNKYFYNSAE